MWRKAGAGAPAADGRLMNDMIKARHTTLYQNKTPVFDNFLVFKFEEIKINRQQKSRNILNKRHSMT